MTLVNTRIIHYCCFYIQLVCWILFLQCDVGQSQPARAITLTSNLTQSDMICGETIKEKMWIGLNEEPGTSKDILVDIASTVTWAKFYIADNEGYNTWQWEEYVKRKNLLLPIKVVLSVPGCLPRTSFEIYVTGRYAGSICDETLCELSINYNQNNKLTLTTSPPQVGQLIIEPFNVIPSKWTQLPIKFQINHQLLPNEKLYVTPYSLLKDAIQFRTHLSHTTDSNNFAGNDFMENVVEFSYARRLFGTTSYVYVYGKRDLAMGSEIQMQCKLQCEECVFNQFFYNLAKPFVINVAPNMKQRFLPLYIPTMKKSHKYCFNLKLMSKSNAIIMDISIMLQSDCSAFHIEPKQLSIKTNKNKNYDTFCIIPKLRNQICQLTYYLIGNGSPLYHKPNPVTLYSIEYKNITIKHFTFDSIIQVTNRKLTTLYLFKWDKRESSSNNRDDFIDVTLIPYFAPDPFMFQFRPTKFHVTHLSAINFFEFTFFPNVDCPIRVNDSNMSVYWVIDWNITGFIGNYIKPHPIYIKVIENLDETVQQMDWCAKTAYDCANLPNGMTCIPDECVINPNDKHCEPLYIYGDPFQFGLKHWFLLTLVLSISFWFIGRQCGCIPDADLPSIDDEKVIEEKKMFNTAENLREAQVAIEQLLWQLYRYEQNLDISKKYEKDVFKGESYFND